jgi:hypothetical protein
MVELPAPGTPVYELPENPVAISECEYFAINIFWSDFDQCFKYRGMFKHVGRYKCGFLSLPFKRWETSSFEGEQQIFMEWDKATAWMKSRSKEAAKLRGTDAITSEYRKNGY